jgi:hypothetical protein
MKYYYQSFAEMDEYHSDIFYEYAEWDTMFAWLPVRCDLTGKRIWLKEVDRATSMFTGPGDPIIEQRYHERKEHLLWILKR